LEYYYDPILQRDPLEVFQTEYYTSLREFEKQAPDWTDEYKEQLDEHYNMGISMLTFYKDYAAKHDDFEVIAAEQDFQVLVGYVNEHDYFIPVGDTNHDLVRSVPVLKPVYYCGRMDAVVRDRATGRYGIIDHKTTSSFGEGYFDKLDMDEQCTSYMWAAQEYARNNDLPYKQIDFVIYNVLRKTTIKPPTVLSSGKLSINRQTEACTYEMFMEAVKANNLAWQLEDPRVQAYVEYLEEEGEGLFIKRQTVRRNAHEINHLADRVKMEISDMFGAHIYPNPTGDWYCMYCPFRAPCLAVNDGSDYQAMLEANYTSNMIEGQYTAY
jgi:hypothetical protein